MDPAKSLMLGGIVAQCPDCGSEQILVEVAPTDYCCAGCDAAVVLVDVLLAPQARRRQSRSRAS